MDARFLHHYNRELQFMREMGGEFAREFPKVAGRLGLESFECSDPYVERLLEGFAFLTARVQLKMDAEFPRFSQHLLEILYPHYLAPVPSMVVARLEPNLSEGSWSAGIAVPRGTVLRGQLGRGDTTACEYRTAHPLTLWPVEVVSAEYTGFLGDMGEISFPRVRRARAALRLQLRSGSGFQFCDLALSRLPLFLRGGDELAHQIYEQLMANTMALVMDPGAQPGAGRVVNTQAPVQPLGFEDDEALLPYGPRSFQGYRLLQEYFACPSRFMFAELCGLDRVVRSCAGDRLSLTILFDTLNPRLEGRLSADNFMLHCTPAINLFPKKADRIHLSEQEPECHVVPDRTRPMDFEVHSVTRVTGHGSASDDVVDFRPLYAVRAQDRGQEPTSFFTIERKPRLLSQRQQGRGARSSYVGSELFVSLVDKDEGPYRPSLKQLAVEILATNRDLPLLMSLGQGRTDFTLDIGVPVRSIRCVSGPTAPRPSHALGDPTWRFISHLSLNHLSLVDTSAEQGPAALREMLRLYIDDNDAASLRQIDSLRSISAAPVTRRLPVAGAAVFGRGLEITLTLDELAAQGHGAYLLGAVMERFFAKYVSINSFTEMNLRSTQRGEVARWPARIGRRQTV